MKNLFTSLIWGSLFSIALISVSAKEVHFGSSIVTLSVVSHEPTIFRFPSNVKTVSNQIGFSINPIDQDNPDYSELKVISNGIVKSAYVNFILDDGTVVRTRLLSLKKRITGRTDDIFTFAKDEDGKESSIRPISVTKLDLLKGMIRGDKVSGFRIVNEGRWLKRSYKGLKIQLLKVYLGKDFKGHEFLILNGSKKRSFRLKLREISLGSDFEALAGQIDHKKLYPKGTQGKPYFTRVRIITKASFGALSSLPKPEGLGGKR